MARPYLRRCDRLQWRAVRKDLLVKEFKMRRFYLQREVDATGTSGTGKVAEGVMFQCGRVAMTWLSHFGTVSVYDNIQVVTHLHGHDGATSVIWIDE